MAVCTVVRVGLVLVVAHLVAASQPVTIVQIVADDLGYNDLSFANGNKTHTPNIASLVKNGIHIPQYYTYKVCSPTRASIMTGRYPWNVGYYDMTGPEEVGLEHDMLPKALKMYAPHHYETAAMGKWNLGSFTKDYTPTFRGFDTFLGYYNAAQGDYWYHGGSVPNCVPNSTDYRFFTDFSNSSGLNDPAGVHPADSRLNGTYNSEIFAERAIDLIGKPRNDTTGLYLYLAFHSVHSTGSKSVDKQQAPCDLVDKYYSTTVLDTYKTQGGMLTALDDAVGRVVVALEAAKRPYLITFCSDNGGPLPHSTNAPLRGGKHTLWEGGVRVVSFVAGSIIPEASRGSVFPGMAHSSDWYRTLVEGVAGATESGKTPADSHNLWPALVAGEAGPRTEVVHQVVNNYTAAQGLKDPPVIRVGNYKLILGDPGDSTVSGWPAPAAGPVPFGHSNGTKNMYPGETNHCRAPDLSRPILRGSCSQGCLFDLSADLTESHNLINHPGLQDIVRNLTQRLAEAAATGPPWAFPLPFNSPILQALKAEICAEQFVTGYFEPVETHVPDMPPVPAPCNAACTAACPHSRFPIGPACANCTHKSASVKAACSPRERNWFCNVTSLLPF